MSKGQIKIMMVVAYFLGITAIYSPVLAYAYKVGQEREIEESEKIAIDRNEYPDKVIKQKVNTTFHDYTVVIRKGKVVANGVMHHHNCKCKIKNQ
jgi:hypothetical protein